MSLHVDPHVFCLPRAGKTLSQMTQVERLPEPLAVTYGFYRGFVPLMGNHTCQYPTLPTELTAQTVSLRLAAFRPWGERPTGSVSVSRVKGGAAPTISWPRGPEGLVGPACAARDSNPQPEH